MSKKIQTEIVDPEFTPLSGSEEEISSQLQEIAVDAQVQSQKSLKFRIKANLVADTMASSKASKRRRTITLNSLRESGLKRAATDNLDTQDYEFSLKTICTLAEELNIDEPFDLIDGINTSSPGFPSATEPHFIQECFMPGHVIQNFGVPRHKILRPLSSKNLKRKSLVAEKGLADLKNLDWMLSTQELTEKLAYETTGSMFSDEPTWINTLAPEIVTKNAEALKLFQDDFQKALLLSDAKANSRQTTLNNLVEDSSLAVDAKTLELKVSSEDYCIFYCPILRDVRISEEAIGSPSQAKSVDEKMWHKYCERSSYHFGYKPQILDHFLILAHPKTEFLLFESAACLKEKHTFSTSSEHGPVWCRDLWNRHWDDCGEPINSPFAVPI